MRQAHGRISQANHNTVLRQALEDGYRLPRRYHCDIRDSPLSRRSPARLKVLDYTVHLLRDRLVRRSAFWEAHVVFLSLSM